VGLSAFARRCALRLATRAAATSVTLFAALIAAMLVALGCAGGGGSRKGAAETERVVVSDGWLSMGTFFEADLRVRPAEVAIAKTWLAWAKVELARMEAVYSRHDPASQVSALNRALAQETVVVEGVAVGPALETLLAESIAVWSATGGAFDVTIGPLVDVWNNAGEKGEMPTVEALRDAKSRVGSDRLQLLGGGRIAVTAPRIRVDLDGISKGAALDFIGAALVRVLPDAPALLSFGQSSTLALGDPDGGGGWILAVQSRDPAIGKLATLRVRDRAISVSSSLGSFSEIGGTKVSHVIDPRTGSTVEGTVEAIVVAERAAPADGWDTGLLVLGAQRSTIRLVEKAGLEAYVFDSSGRTVSTAGWEAYLAEADLQPAAPPN
jgi:FAD:protein FMN transferase